MSRLHIGTGAVLREANGHFRAASKGLTQERTADKSADFLIMPLLHLASRHSLQRLAWPNGLGERWILRSSVRRSNLAAGQRHRTQIATALRSLW